MRKVGNDMAELILNGICIALNLAIIGILIARWKR